MTVPDAPPRAVTVASVVSFLALGVAVSSYGPSIPHIATRFDVTLTVAGLIVTAQFLGECIGITVFGLTESRWSIGGRLVVGASMFSVGLLAAGVAPTWPLVLLAVLVSGSGAGGLVVLINLYFATRFGRRSPAMVGFVNTAYGAGAILGPALVGVAGGYAPVLAGAGVAGLLCIAPFRGAPDAAARDEATLRTGPRGRGLMVAFAVLLLVYAGIETGVSTWEATDLVASGWSLQFAAGATSFFWGAFTVGRIIASPLASRVAPERILVPVLVVALVLLVGIRVQLISPLGLVLVGFCAGPVFPVVLSWVARVTRDTPTAMTYALLGALLGSAVVPAALGGLIGLAGITALPLGIAACAIASIVMVILIAAGRTGPVARGSAAAD